MTKTHKDSLFRSILNHEKPLLQIYNALRRTHYSAEQAEIVINTLGETLWTAKKNDISFSVNNELIVMLEHQSTINENMPLRFLQIITRLFENQIENKKDLYKQKQIKLQRPIFVVFYIGKAPFPPFKIMRLSDAFKDVAGFEGITLELEAWVFNIK